MPKVDCRIKILQIMRAAVRTNIPQRMKDSPLSEKSMDVAGHCLHLLEQDKANLVSQALDDLSDKEKNHLFEEWSSKDAPIAYQLLRLYFLPLSQWKIENKSNLILVQKQLKNPSPSLSKHLITVLKIKYLFHTNKYDEVLKLLRQPNIFHLNLSGLKLNDKSLDFSHINFEGANLQAADLSWCKFNDANFKNANLINSTLFGTQLSESNLENVNLSYAKITNANFYAALLINANLHRVTTNNGLSTNGSEAVNFKEAVLDGCHLDGATPSVTRCLSDAFIQEYIKKKKYIKNEFDSLIDHLENWKFRHKTLAFFCQKPPMRKYYELIEQFGYVHESPKEAATIAVVTQMHDEKSYSSHTLRNKGIKT